MKYLLSSIIFLLSIIGSAQNSDLINAKKLSFYGIDFSKAQVWLAKESNYDFAKTFNEINQLFFTEATKYNIPLYLNKDVIKIERVSSIMNIEDIDYDLRDTDRSRKFSDSEIQELLNGYPEGKYELGAVIIANILNKEEAYASYYLVYFNTKTKEILSISENTGKAGGFGLRNFWARSVFNFLKMSQISF